MYEMHNCDALAFLATLADASIDLIATDLPYGTTACSWDTIIPFVPMWEQVKRVLKPHGAFVTTASQPFTSKLVMSNLEWFRYEWIWEKDKATGHLDARRKPLKAHESILVFSGNPPTYMPQMGRGASYTNHHRPNDTGDVYGGQVKHYSFENKGTRFPRTIIPFAHVPDPCHPTQKPVSLYAYLIRTYTNPGDTVLDPFAGSGTTGVACIQLGRNFIGVEINEHYFRVGTKRLEDAAAQLPLFDTYSASVEETA